MADNSSANQDESVQHPAGIKTPAKFGRLELYYVKIDLALLVQIEVHIHAQQIKLQSTGRLFLLTAASGLRARTQEGSRCHLQTNTTDIIFHERKQLRGRNCHYIESSILFIPYKRDK